MKTLKFQTHRDLSYFQMITGVLDQYIDDDNLLVKGPLPEAEVELACNAFNAEVIDMETGVLMKY